MISQIIETERIDFDVFPKNCYQRLVKSHFDAYQLKYDFCRFYYIIDKQIIGIISLFNSSMTVCFINENNYSDDVIDEILMFINLNKPDRIEIDEVVARKISNKLSSEYISFKRIELVYDGKIQISEIEVIENPKLDDVYKVLSQCFPKLKDSYELWLTDTSHRTRRNLYRSFLVGNHTTVAIQYVIDDIAVIGSIATLPEFRGKRFARNLIKYICNLLQNERLNVHLFAKEERLSFYEEIGFKPVFSDLVFERKEINE